MNTSGADVSTTTSGHHAPHLTVREQEETSPLVTAIFSAWQQAAIPFLVLRNYEHLPRFTSNDIDVLVARADRPRAERIMLEVAASYDFRRHNRAEFATLANYFCSLKSTAQIHFDLFVDLKWRSFDFLDCRDFLGDRIVRGVFAIPHPAHEAATNLLATMIYNGSIKEKYKPSITAGFRDHPAKVRNLLSLTYGISLAESVVEAGINQRWEQLQQLTPALRRTLIRRQILRRPLATAGAIVNDWHRLTGRWLAPPGLFVVLCGADGSGKSTGGKALIESLVTTFPPSKGRQFHWKPPVFSAGRMAARAPTTDPHARPPRALLLSLPYFAFHWVEFILGFLLRIKPVAFKGGLVLIDRWYSDFFVDQRRYRLRIPLWLVGLGYRLLKKPDLVLLLDAPPEVLHQRKQEVPLPETQRQREAYLELIQRLPQGRIINASLPPEKVCRELTHATLTFMVSRMQNRCPSASK